MNDLKLSEEEKNMVVEFNDIFNERGFRKPINWEQYPENVVASFSLFPTAFISQYITDKALEKAKLDRLKEITNSLECKERDILKFFSEKGNLKMLSVIFKYFQTGHHSQYIFREFALPNTDHVADFLLIGKSSDGYHEIFVEFEAIHSSKSSKVFTKTGEGNILRKGREQVQSWEDSINKQHSSHTMNLKKNLRSEQTLPNELQENSPNRRHYVVVAGRRADFQRNYDLKLRLQENNKIIILHYDNIIDDIQEIIEEKTRWF